MELVKATFFTPSLWQEHKTFLVPRGIRQLQGLDGNFFPLILTGKLEGSPQIDIDCLRLHGFELQISGHLNQNLNQQNLSVRGRREQLVTLQANFGIFGTFLHYLFACFGVPCNKSCMELSTMFNSKVPSTAGVTSFSWFGRRMKKHQETSRNRNPPYIFLPHLIHTFTSPPFFSPCPPLNRPSRRTVMQCAEPPRNP